MIESSLINVEEKMSRNRLPTKHFYKQMFYLTIPPPPNQYYVILSITSAVSTARITIS